MNAPPIATDVDPAGSAEHRGSGLDPIFAKLTPAQADSMNWHAFNGYAGGRPGARATTARLVRLGLLHEEPAQIRDRLGTIHYSEYFVPLHIHLAWCEWISRDLDPSELA